MLTSIFGKTTILSRSVKYANSTRCRIGCFTSSTTNSKNDTDICNIIKTRAMALVEKHRGNYSDPLTPNALLHSHIGGTLMSGFRVIPTSGVCFQHFWVEKYNQIFDASASQLEIQNKTTKRGSGFEYSTTPQGIEYDKIEQPTVRKKQQSQYNLYINNPKAYFNGLSNEMQIFVDNCNQDISIM